MLRGITGRLRTRKTAKNAMIIIMEVISMKFSVVFLVVAAALIFPFSAFAVDYVPGEVIAVFANPFDAKVTAESVSLDTGGHGLWLKDTAESLNAEVVKIYESISVAGDDLMVLLRARDGNAEALLEAVRARPDVTASSLNYIRKFIKGGAK